MKKYRKYLIKRRALSNIFFDMIQSVVASRIISLIWQPSGECGKVFRCLEINFIQVAKVVASFVQKQWSLGK